MWACEPQRRSDFGAHRKSPVRMYLGREKSETQTWKQNSVVSSKSSQSMHSGCPHVWIPLLMGCDGSVQQFRKIVLEVD